MKGGGKLRGVIITFIITAYIFLFTYAAVSKLNEYKMFEIQIGQSPILEPFAWMLVWIVPSMELLLAVILFFDRFRFDAMYASVALMSLFTYYIIAATTLTPYVPCSCGGILESMGWNEHLVFNIGFIVLGVAAILMMEHDRQGKETLLTT